MRRFAIPWRWIGLWLLFFLAALVLTAPADLIPWLLRKNPNWLVQDLQGSLWKGQAQRITWQRPGSAPRTLGSLNWDIHLWSLLRGKIRLDTQLQGPGGRFAAQIEKDGDNWHISDLTLQAPAAFWAAQSPRIQPFGLGGDWQGKIQNISLGPDNFSVYGDIHWHNASASLSPNNPIGNYQLTLKGRQLALSTQSGTLQLEGQGEIQADRSFQLSGSAQANSRDLNNLLSLLGPDQGNGVHIFSLRFRLGD